MTNLDWPSAMDALLRSTSDLGDAWEAVEFRFLLGPAHSGFVVPEGAYFEPTIEPLPGDLRVAFETPLLLQGRMSVMQFVCRLQTQFYRLVEGVVIDDSAVPNAKLREWEHFYNFERPHAALDGQTPYERLRQKTGLAVSASNVS